MSANCAPHALSVPAALGSSTAEQPSSRASTAALSPPAPPPATSVHSRGSTPWLIVISRIAATIASFAIARIAQAARSSSSRSGIATSRRTASRAASASRVMRPPRKYCGSR